MKTYNELDVFAWKSFGEDGVRLCVSYMYTDKNGDLQHDDIIWDKDKPIRKFVPEGGERKSFIFLSNLSNQAQRLMDNLWDCGIRPTQGKGSAGQLKAVESHLNDMRKIVFKKLGLNEN